MIIFQVKQVRKKKRKQLTLAPKGLSDSFNSQASTVPMDHSMDERMELIESEMEMEDAADDTFQDLELEIPGDIVENDLSDLEEENGRIRQDDPMRDDMPIVRSRWSAVEVDALFTALNVNRDAIKFHFDGPGGGREVKRQAWRDVAGELIYIS